MSKYIRVERNVLHAQAFGCFAVLQIWTLLIAVGKTNSAPRIRVELLRPIAPRFRFSIRPERAKVKA